MRQFKDLAVVLKRKKFGEADNLITVFSKNHGKLEILAKGSRKIKSKFIGHLEPFSLVRISVVSGRSFEILTSIQLEKSFLNLKEDLDKLSLINFISEITDSITAERVSNPKLFNLILKTLSSNAWKNKPRLISLFFLIKLLELLGYAPHLDYCVKCKNKELEPLYFSYYWGGVLCKNCKDSYPLKKINKETLDVLKKLQRIPSDNVEKIVEDFGVSPNNKESLDFISNFFIFINDKKPNSLKFVEKLSG